MMRARFFLLLLLAGCVDFVEIPTQAVNIPGFALASADVRVVQPAEGADTVAVGGWVGVQAEPVEFVDDTLRILGRALVPKRGQGGIDRTYDSLLVLPAGAPREGAVEVKLPVVRGVEFVPAAFRGPIWVRSGPSKLVLAKGADLVLPTIPGVAPAEFGAPSGGYWNLNLQRGGQYFGVTSTGFLPARIVVPASQVPEDTARFMSVRVSAGHFFQRKSRSDSTEVRYSTGSEIVWQVEVVP